MQTLYSHIDQHPYNPNMLSDPSSQQPQYTIDAQPASQDAFFALERLLLGVSPFPPTMPTLAKPTCPSMNDQFMVDTSSVPSIILNEQSLGLLQHFYQTQDSHQHQLQSLSEYSSSSPTDSPPSSPYNYASPSASSPALEPPASWGCSLYEQMSMPLAMSDYASPFTSFLDSQQQVQPLQQVTAPLKMNKDHHRRSSSICSAISAYDCTARREHRASSIASDSSAPSSPSGSSKVKSYACSICSKPFPTRTQLKSHMAIHTDSFPFPCPHDGCDLSFKRKHDLRRHVDAKHSLVKKYLCSGGCGEGFGRRDQLVRHHRRGTCSGVQGFQSE